MATDLRLPSPTGPSKRPNSEICSAAATNFLEAADPSTRLRWAERAKAVEVNVPNASREEVGAGDRADGLRGGEL